MTDESSHKVNDRAAAERAFTERQDAMLAKIPEEFRNPVQSRAWETGHGYGYIEVLSHTEDLVDMLTGPIGEYTRRIKGETK